MVEIQRFNGSGQVVLTATTSNAKTIYIKKAYDGFGNEVFKSYPSSSSNPTKGIVNTYDDFGRVVTVNNNGAQSTYCYQYCADLTGAVATVTDADGVSILKYYALGDFNIGILTSYQQQGNDGSSLSYSISYDANLLKPTIATLGRSKQTYTYNSDGLVQTAYDSDYADSTKKSIYEYDAAGRVKKLTNPDGSVEDLTYDLNHADLISTRVKNDEVVSYAYTAAGRLRSASHTDSTLIFDLDNYGRTTQIKQSISGAPSKNYTVIYGYNNLSQVTKITYPNGKSVDLSGRNGFGEVNSIPGLIQSISYDVWHQPKLITANDDVVWSYSYDVDGKPKSLNYQAIGSCQLSLTYVYDELRRIKTIDDGCNSSLYDAVLERYGTGQLKKADLSQGIYEYSYSGDDIATVKISGKQAGVNNSNYTYNYLSGTSRLQSITGSGYGAFTYDALNRVKNDGVRTLTYDALGRVKQAGTEQFYYAPNNLRVRAVRSNETTDYMYGQDGELLYEVNLTTGLAKSYVYAGGILLATLESYPDSDTDRDGLNDVEEQEAGLDTDTPDAFRDGDDDGLPDYLEKYLGLNPDNEDSDGDGYSDGYEFEKLGLLAALKANIFPGEPQPGRNEAIIPILGLLLDDES